MSKVTTILGGCPCGRVPRGRRGGGDNDAKERVGEEWRRFSYFGMGLGATAGAEGFHVSHKNFSDKLT